MQDIRIGRAFPDMPAELQHAALLADLLDMDRKAELSRQSIERTAGDDERLAELVVQTGTDHQMRDAQETIQASIIELIDLVSERELGHAKELGLLTVEDYDEAIRLKRLLDLERTRGRDRGHDLGRET